jgi:hypothetical protein
MSLHNDSHIEKLFSEQRVTDQQRVPGFARTWQAATARDWSPPLAAWCLPALAGAALLAVAVTWWQARPAHGLIAQAPKPVTVIASLSDWTAPSDVLLSDDAMLVPVSQP